MEAGRPDSLDIEKLRMLKAYGVDRISINPQTMNASTLRDIGRAHTPDAIVDSFRSARRISFDCINMDVIVGLPGEGLADIENTMREIYELSPDNLTIHALAIKRGSPLREHIGEYEFVDGSLAEKMLTECKRWAGNMYMTPYYL